MKSIIEDKKISQNNFVKVVIRLLFIIWPGPNGGASTSGSGTKLDSWVIVIIVIIILLVIVVIVLIVLLVVKIKRSKFTYRWVKSWQKGHRKRSSSKSNMTEYRVDIFVIPM